MRKDNKAGTGAQNTQPLSPAAEKYIEGQRLIPVKKRPTVAVLWQLLSLSLAGLPRLILHNSTWIHNDIKTKIHPLSQHGKSLWIHSFS
jgi:hypothetical protein